MNQLVGTSVTKNNKTNLWIVSPGASGSLPLVPVLLHLLGLRPLSPLLTPKKAGPSDYSQLTALLLFVYIAFLSEWRPLNSVCVCVCVRQQGLLLGGRCCRAAGRPSSRLPRPPRCQQPTRPSRLQRKAPGLFLAESFVLLCLWVRPRFSSVCFPYHRLQGSERGRLPSASVPLCTGSEPSLCPLQSPPILWVSDVPSASQSTRRGKTIRIHGLRFS